MKEKKKEKTKKMPRWKRIVRYRCWRLSKSMKLSERIVATNNWAKKNPKVFFGGVFGILVLCVVMSATALVASFLVPDTESGSGKEEQSVFDIGNIQPTMNGFRTIDMQKKQEQREVNSLIDHGMELKKELDSLRRLPVMTHDDSIRYANDYNRLEDIVNFLNKRERK